MLLVYLINNSLVWCTLVPLSRANLSCGFGCLQCIDCYCRHTVKKNPCRADARSSEVMVLPWLVRIFPISLAFSKVEDEVLGYRTAPKND